MKIIEKPQPETTEVTFKVGGIYKHSGSKNNSYYICVNTEMPCSDNPKKLLINLRAGNRWGADIPGSGSSWEEVEAELHIL